MLAQLLATVLQLLGITQTVRALVAGLTEAADGWTTLWNSLVAPITGTYVAVTSGPDALAVLDGKLDALALLLAAARSDILTAVTPVTLPAAPPSGWATPTAEAVWDYYPPTGNGRQAATLLVNAGALAENMGAYAVLPINGKPAFGYQGSWDSLYHSASVIYPDPDFDNIRQAENRLAWLQRTDLSGLTWGLGVGSEPAALAHPADPDSNWIVVCLFSEAEFEVWKTANRRHLAPIWPGLANATLGAPVALSSDLTVPGPLDGLLVDITTPPTGLGKFAMGGFTAYYRIGEISFVSDNGQAEPWQYVSLDQSLYCPRQQTRAAAAILRILAGAGGTATPWLGT